MSAVSDAEVLPLLPPERSKRPAHVSQFINVRYRCFRYRGAALLLVWHFVVLFTFILLEAVAYGGVKASAEPTVMSTLLFRFNFICFFLYPLAGMVADLLCGRYNVVMFSVVINIGLLLLGVVAVAVALTTSGKEAIYVVLFLGAVVLAVHSFFLANALQFGADHLQDASSEELRSFIYWFVWLYALAQLPIVIFENPYVTSTHWNVAEYAALAIAATVLLAAAMLLVCHFTYFKLSTWFTREPPSRNPYITVCRVLDFYRKHRVPLNRSSLTYWEEALPPRMDLAKSKYGGPFSDEEVEDVKTMMGVSAVLLSLGSFGYLQVAALPLAAFIHHLGGNSGFKLVVTFLASPVFVSVFAIPIHEALYRVCSHRISMLGKLKLAIAMYVIGTGVNLLVDAVGHTLVNNMQCMFDKAESLIDVHSLFIFLPALFSSLATVTINVTSMEFIIAQSPYSMRGTLIGLFFFSQGMFGFIASLSILPFTLEKVRPETGPHLSCCSLYYVINFVLVALMSAIFWLVAQRYQLRKRTEVINEYQIIEENYTRRIDQRRPYEDSLNDDQ